jgi:glyoxylate reductase
VARVFVSAPLPGDAVERLRAVADVTVGTRIGDEEFVRGAASWDAVVALLTDRIDAAILDASPRLRVVANVAVGVDNIDVAACRARNVVVSNTPDVLTEATADFTFALMLAAARRVAEGDRLVRSGGFTGWTPTLLLGTCVHGATLGIVGLGRIGRAVARRARGFGMHVVYAQRTRLDEPLARALGVAHVDLDELFTRSDIVTLHCPLTPETRGLVDAARLAKMKLGSVLVNTARGLCIDEAALAEALTSGPLAAAGLDVFAEEPRVHPALLACENVVLAPHIGSAEKTTREAMARIAADNVVTVLAGSLAPNGV